MLRYQHNFIPNVHAREMIRLLARTKRGNFGIRYFIMVQAIISPPSQIMSFKQGKAVLKINVKALGFKYLTG